MSDSEERNDGEGQEGQYVEIDWTPIELAIDGMAEGGLDLDNGPVVLDHIAALLASCLRKLSQEAEWDEDKAAEAAAEVAAFAVDLAMGDDELPPFEAWSGDEEE